MTQTGESDIGYAHRVRECLRSPCGDCENSKNLVLRGESHPTLPLAGNRFAPTRPLHDTARPSVKLPVPGAVVLLVSQVEYMSCSTAVAHLLLFVHYCTVNSFSIARFTRCVQLLIHGFLEYTCPVPAFALISAFGNGSSRTHRAFLVSNGDPLTNEWNFVRQPHSTAPLPSYLRDSFGDGQQHTRRAVCHSRPRAI